MGAGKTTTGRLVAEELGYAFDDLDDLIESACGMPIPEIFAAHGEAYFRAVERRELLKLLETDADSVVALGGGTPAQPGLMDAILETSQVFWLRCPVPVMSRRVLSEGPKKRPLMAAFRSNEEVQEALATRLSEREPHYRRAHFTIDVNDGDAPRHVAQRILSQL